jgi:hypothetical protein
VIMAAIERDSADQFRIRFDELARKAVKGFRRGSVVEIDPYLLARAFAAVMSACTFRTATGRRLLWNEYRMILTRADFERVRALQGPLERDLGEALAGEAAATGAELVGDLRVSVVPDEGNELRDGAGVVRVGFVPSAKLPVVQAGELTVRFDAVRLTGLMKAVGSTETVIVQDTGAGVGGYRLRWPGGEAALPRGTTLVVGRPHDGAPASFVSLTGASAKINKQHGWIEAGAGVVRIGRYAAANPLHVNGTALAPGGELAVAPPVELTLSRGELVLHVTVD